MLLSKNYPQKKFWFKYAGNWKDKVSFFYEKQRKKLISLPANCKTTINGFWDDQPKNVFCF